MPESLFPIPAEGFPGGPEFRAYLASADPARWGGRPLTMVVGLTRRSKEALFEALRKGGLRIAREYGGVSRLASSGDVKLEAYLTIEDGGVLVFYTNYRKTEDVPLITEFLAKDGQSRPLRLRSSVIRKSLDSLLEVDSGLRVTRFTARGYPGSPASGLIRPGRTRTFGYWGDDGREVLEELSQQYGVQPTSLVVDLPGKGKVAIDERGIFTHHRGDLSLAFQTLGTAIGEAKRNTLAIDKARFEVFSLRQKNARFEIPRCQPALIQLHSKFSYVAAETFFVETLGEREYGRLNLLTQEGSLFVSTDIISPEGVRFRVRADEDRIRMIPTEATDFRTLLSFYELVLDHVDPDAELVA